MHPDNIRGCKNTASICDVHSCSELNIPLRRYQSAGNSRGAAPFEVLFGRSGVGIYDCMIY